MTTITSELLERARRFPVATLHEAAGRAGALPASIKPVDPDFRVCGRAYPLQCLPGHNLRLHHALLTAAPGDVLVADVGEGMEYGYWGEILSAAAKAKGLGGLVIHGCVRDRVELTQSGFPVFATGLCVRGTGKTPGGSVGEPVRVGDVQVAPGDLVVGDVDGVIVLPAQSTEQVVQAAGAREAAEAEILARIARGEDTVTIYGFPPPEELPLNGAAR